MPADTITAEEARKLLWDGRLLSSVIPHGPQDDGTYLLCLDDDADTDIGRVWTSDDAGRIALAVNKAEVLARTVIALEADLAALRIEHGAVVGLLQATRVERDRLRDILDAETGKRGPEGWQRVGRMLRCWERELGMLQWARTAPLGNDAGTRWSVVSAREDDPSHGLISPLEVIAHGIAPTALEAMEAADAAAKEKA